MFKEIALLFRHKVFLKNSTSQRKRKFSLLYLIGMSAFFLFFITRMFNDVYTQLSQIVVGGINYGDVYINFLMTLIAIFFVISFASMMSFQLKRNDEIEFLLTLPIRKSSIVTYQLLTSGISMFFSLIMFLSPVIVYLSKRPIDEIILGTLGIIINILFLVLLGAILAVLFSRIGSQKTARVMLIIVNMGMGAIYILMFQVLPNNLTSPEAFPEALIKANELFRSIYNVFIMGLNGSENLFYLILLVAITAVLGYFYYSLADEMSFHSTGTGKRKKRKDKGIQVKSNMILRKELILYKRHEQLIYYILYPVGFAIFMGIINSNIFSAVYMVSIMGPLFMAMQTSFSMNLEGTSIETTRMLPISLKKYVQTKLFVPVGLNAILLLITFIVFAIFLDASLLSFVLLPFIILLEILAAISGVYFILRREPQKLNNPGAFLRSGAFLVQYLMLMVLSLLTLIPLSIIILNTDPIQSTLIRTLMIAAGFAGATIAIILSLRFWKHIKRLILVWQ